MVVLFESPLSHYDIGVSSTHSSPQIAASGSSRRRRDILDSDVLSVDFELVELMSAQKLPRRNKRSSSGEVVTECNDGSVLLDGECSKYYKHQHVRFEI